MSGSPKNNIYGLLSALIFGISIVVNKIGLTVSSLTPFQFTTVATTTAALLGLPFIITSSRKVRNMSQTAVLQTLFVGIGSGAVAYFLMYWGQQLTTAINAGFLVTLSLFLTLPFSALLLKEKFERRKYYYVPVLIVGMYLLIVGLGGISFNIGDLLIVLSTVIFSFNNALSKFPVKEVGGELFSYLRNLIGAVVLIVTALLLDVLPSLGTIELWVILAGVLVWGTLLFWYKAIDTIGPSKSAIILLSYPVISTVLSILVLQEVFTLSQAFGGGLILFSIYKVIKK